MEAHATTFQGFEMAGRKLLCRSPIKTNRGVTVHAHKYFQPSLDMNRFPLQDATMYHGGSRVVVTVKCRSMRVRTVRALCHHHAIQHPSVGLSVDGRINHSRKDNLHTKYTHVKELAYATQQRHTRPTMSAETFAFPSRVQVHQ